jgi:hypothetical protein
MTVPWAVLVLIALGASAPAQDEDEWLRQPVCGHHGDVRGFSLDLPAPLCGHRYLHGFWVGLSGVDADAHRSIVVWASANADFYKTSRDIAVAAVDAQKSESVGGVHVVGRAPTAVEGVPAERWRYTFRSRPDARERLVDLVAILRPLRPKPKWFDYYEYSISLNTTPQDYATDVKVFEAVLGTLSFSEPEI